MRNMRMYEKSPRDLSRGDFWYNNSDQIRTVTLLVLSSDYSQTLVQRQCSNPVLVVKPNQNLAIMQINGVDKGINQQLSLLVDAYVQISELVKPKGYLLFRQPWAYHFFL